jgi:hypothetical protein
MAGCKRELLQFQVHHQFLNDISRDVVAFVLTSVVSIDTQQRFIYNVITAH